MHQARKTNTKHIDINQLSNCLYVVLSTNATVIVFVVDWIGNGWVWANAI